MVGVVDYVVFDDDWFEDEDEPLYAEVVELVLLELVDEVLFCSDALELVELLLVELIEF